MTSTQSNALKIEPLDNNTVAESLKRTPIFKCHSRSKAKFTPFGGWEMPVLYTGLIDEHITVRTKAGLFDVSHMGEIMVDGPNAFDYLQYVTSNDVSKLKPGLAQYSVLLNESGGVVDDIIVYRLAEHSFLVCVNASNTEKDYEWFKKHERPGVTIKNVSSEFAQIAVQGPLAQSMLASLLGQTEAGLTPENFPAFTFRTERLGLGSMPARELIIARTGYTGEDGFEIFCASEQGAALWDKLLEIGGPLGAKPIGLGARDTLRLEVCYPLYGHELLDSVCALSSGVGWVIKTQKGDFIGKAALLKEKEAGLKLKLVGLEVLDPGIIREGAKLYKASAGSNQSSEEIGWVTSGTKLPSVQKAMALAFVNTGDSSLENVVEADVRGKRLKCKVIKTPFYKRPGK